MRSLSPQQHQSLRETQVVRMIMLPMHMLCQCYLSAEGPLTLQHCYGLRVWWCSLTCGLCSVHHIQAQWYETCNHVFGNDCPTFRFY